MPGGAPVDARERHVDDVLGEVLVAAGDEDLRAAQQVVPSAAGVARVVTSARLEPACGSVSAIVPVHSPRVHAPACSASRSASSPNASSEVRRARGQPDVAVGATGWPPSGRRSRASATDERQLLAADRRRPRRRDHARARAAAARARGAAGARARGRRRSSAARRRSRGRPGTARRARSGGTRRCTPRPMSRSCSAKYGSRSTASSVEHLVEEEVDVAIVEQRVRHAPR